MTDPIGARNNNPLNLRPGQPWEGMTGQDGGFVVFSSPVWGFRAAVKVYIHYADRGLDTITKIISTWAPSSENDTAAYIASVCQSTGYGPDDVLKIKTYDVCSAMLYAQTIVECGSFDKYFTQAQMAEGCYRAGIVDAPAPLLKRVTQIAASSGAALGAAATAAQPVVSGWMGISHSATVQIIIGAATLLLAIIAGFAIPKPANT